MSRYFSKIILDVVMTHDSMNPPRLNKHITYGNVRKDPIKVFPHG